MGDVIQFSTDYCRFCRKAARAGWNEEAIFGPAGPDGFREIVGWAHPKCLRQETLAVLEQLELMAPQIGELSRSRAALLLAEIAWLRECVAEGTNVSSSMTHLLHRLVEYIFGYIAALPAATAHRHRLQALSSLVEAIQFLGRNTYACEIAAPRLLECFRETA